METYYDPADLGKFSPNGFGSLASGYFEKFMGYYGSVFQDGALTAREKGLIGLGVAIALECPYCIDAHTNGCLQKGCDGEQIAEVYHVVAALSAGAAVAHGAQSLKIIEDNEF